MVLLLLFDVQSWFSVAGKAELAVPARSRPGGGGVGVCLRAKSYFQQWFHLPGEQNGLQRSAGGSHPPPTTRH